MSMRTTRSLLKFFFLVVLFQLGACSLHDERTAGTDTGNPVIEVSGRVLDLAGNPVANAQVSLHSKETSNLVQSQARIATSSTLPQLNTRTTTTDAHGYYHFDISHSGKAYLVADLSDSLGRLDSLEISSDSSTVKDLPLQPNGFLRIENGTYPTGTRVYIVQLNLTLTLDTTALRQSVPPGHYQLLILATNSEESAMQETTVHENDTSLVTGTDASATDTGIVYGTLTDSRDLRTYKTVAIGTQVWMAQNLNFGTLNTATGILQSGSVKYCSKNLPANCEIEGGLYQWHYAMGLPDSCATKGCSNLINANNHQGICPDGWHMPDSADWGILATTLGGDSIAGGKMKLNNTGFASFDDALYNDGNSSGFSAYPAGIRYYDGSFAYHGDESASSNTFWEVEEEASTLYANAYRRAINNLGPAIVRAFNHAKTDAFSIRCLQD